MFHRDNPRIDILAALSAAFGVFDGSRAPVLVGLVLCFSSLFSGCQPSRQQTPQAGPVETIRIGAFKGELAALVWLAESEGFFAKHGLQAQVTSFDSGVAAADALVAGNVDVATASETVFVNHSLAPGSPGNLRVLGEISRSESVQVVARIDRGIASPADLKGKTIALTGRSASPYFLDRYLLYNHIDPRSVTIMDLPPPRIVEALVQGTADAAVTWEPFVAEITQQLAANVRVWPAQFGQAYSLLLICTAGFSEKRPETAKKMFRALADAETMVRSDPAWARQALARQLKLDDRYLVSVWPMHAIGLSLGQSLLIAMEGQARWAISRGFAPAGAQPNYLKILSPEALLAVSPDTVTVYR